MRRSKITEEEKIAKTIGQLIANLTLDLDWIGRYLANHHTTIYNRMITIVEAMEYEKESKYVGKSGNHLWE